MFFKYTKARRYLSRIRVKSVRKRRDGKRNGLRVREYPGDARVSRSGKKLLQFFDDGCVGRGPFDGAEFSGKKPAGIGVFGERKTA